MSHQEIMTLMLCYGLVGFFLACLLAGILSVFKILTIDEYVRRYLFTVLLVSFGGVVVAYIQNILKSPTEFKDEIETQVQEQASQKADAIVEKVTEKKLVYIQVAHRAQRSKAEKLQDDLKAAKFIAPGIEDAWKRSPNALEVRYFSGDKERAQVVANLLETIAGSRPELKEIMPKNRSNGAIEVWFPR